jgi:hypothetical protein
MKSFKVNSKTFLLLPLIGLLLYTGCAQVVRPTGGAPDKKAPEVLRFAPENKSLQFKGKSFSILFNEFFIVREANKQWIISPPLKKTPEYKIKGKLLTITFDDTLKENTTYNFNFGKSIVDVNEGNELLGLSYIFSTGSFIDSLQLTGNVSQALNNAKEKDVLIMLYDESRCQQDSFPYKILPDYFTLSDASGNFFLNYIKPAKYKAIALKDANSNYLFDSHEEAIGMLDSSININLNKNIDFKLFKEIEHKTYLKSKSNGEYGCFNLIFNKPLPNLELLPLHTLGVKDWAYIETNKTKDSVNIFLKDFGIDTLKIALKNNQMAFDTVEFAVQPREKFISKNKRNVAPKTTIKITPANGAEKDINIPVTLFANHPVETIYSDSILFLEGKNKIPFKIVAKDSVKRSFELEAKLETDSSYSLVLLPGAFKDCFGYKNDTIKSNFKVPSMESVGNLYLSLSSDSTVAAIDFNKVHLLLQLLNDKSEVLNSQTVKNYGTFNYLNLKPGNYKAQIVIDSNNNMQWDTGNYLKKQQAEKIIFMNTTMSLRANWDLDEDWKLNIPFK